MGSLLIVLQALMQENGMKCLFGLISMCNLESECSLPHKMGPRLAAASAVSQSDFWEMLRDSHPQGLFVPSSALQ